MRASSACSAGASSTQQASAARAANADSAAGLLAGGWGRAINSPVEVRAAVVPPCSGLPAACVAGRCGPTLFSSVRAAPANALHSTLPAGALASALLAASGLAAGFLAGLLGIGGSLVTVPALYLLLPAVGVAATDVPLAAVATALTVMLPNALAATLAQQCRGGLEVQQLLRLAPGLTLGAAAGALLATQLNGLVLALLFALQSLYYGVGMLRAAPRRAGPTGRFARLARGSAALPGSCVAPAVGALCSCVGMGSGSLLLPYLTLQGAALRRAAATAGALNLFIALGGAAGFAALHGGWAESTCWPAALPMALAATLAAPLGVAAAPRLPLRLFRRALGGVNVLAALVLLLRSLPH